MKQIELSVSTAMSLYVNSFAGSEDEEDFADPALEMSDEEFEAMDPEDFPADEVDPEFRDNEDDDETLGDDDEEEPETEVNEEEPTDTAEDGGSEQTEDEGESKDTQPNEEQLQADEARYQEAFNLLYGDPIKASGREVKIRNPEHARNFIEMGIDYNKKMHAMKPHLKTLKTLEREGLLDAGKEERLNLLLEVEKGNKDALKRFIAESDIDPLDLADEEVIEEGRQYRPQNHMISDQEVEIQEALDAIKGSPSETKTIEAMTQQFDAKSREVISENPRYIVALNQDIENGIYDDVMEAVNYKKDMKQVAPGMSDIELYIQTVQEIASMPINEPAQNVTVPATNQTNQPSAKSNRRRKVGMSGNKSTKKPKKKEYDPIDVLSMSDEEFMKEAGIDIL